MCVYTMQVPLLYLSLFTKAANLLLPHVVAKVKNLKAY